MNIDDGVRRQLESRTPAVSLLPNLRTIVAWTNDIPFISLFLTPRVHHLKLVIQPEQATIFSLALEVPLRSPNLRSLHLLSAVCDLSEEPQVIHALVELLKTLQLEEFICDWFPLSQDMLNAVISMPELSTVDICAEMSDLVRAMDIYPTQEGRMRNFRLCTPLLIPSNLPHIIFSLCPSKLKALSIISHCGLCDATDLTGLISTLVNTCSPEYLTDISIDCDPTHVAVVIDFKMLKPLLQFVHLRRISLPDYLFNLTDAEMKDMAMAWPNLEELSYWRYEYLSSEDLIDIVLKTSLRGLLWLATYCRELYSLTFLFHASHGAMEDLTENEMALGQGHNLRSFDVRCSEIECAEEVARFIKRVFPNLEQLGFSVGGPNADEWEKVEELIQRL